MVRRNSLNMALDDMEAKVRHLEEQLVKQRKVVAQATAETVERDAENARLMEALAVVKGDLLRERAAREDAEARVAVLKSDLTVAESLMLEAHPELEEAKARIGALEEQAQALREELHAANAARGGLTTQLRAKSEENAGLKREVEEAQTRAEVLNRALEREKAHCGQLEAQVTALRIRLTNQPSWDELVQMLSKGAGGAKGSAMVSFDGPGYQAHLNGRIVVVEMAASAKQKV